MFKKDSKIFMPTIEKLNMKEEITQELEVYSRKILNEMPGGQAWEWDDRFDVPLLIFPKDIEGEIYAVMGKHFTNQWNYQDFKTASPVIRKLLDNVFGMQVGQTVFATDTSKEAFLFGLWWPWSDGKTISLRISLAGKGVLRFYREEIGEYLRQWFNL